MKQILSFVIAVLSGLALGSSPAHAIPSSVYTDGNTNLGQNTVGAALPVGVDQKGRLILGSSGGVGDFGAEMSIMPLKVGTDTAETSSTTTVINATSHAARVNDYIKFTAGTAANVEVWRKVSEVAANTITVSLAFPSAPANGDAFTIFRPVPNSSVYAEDTPHVSGDYGVASWQVLQSALTVDAASGDYGAFRGDLDGATIVRFAPSAQTWQSCSSAATGTSDTAIVSGFANNRTYVTSVSCYNTANVASAIVFKNGASQIYAGAVSSSTLAGVAYYEQSFPIPLKTSINTAFNFAMLTTATNTVCCAIGYISPN